MRDKLKDKKYFKKYLSKTDHLIEKTKEDFLKGLVRDERRQTMKLYMISQYVNAVIATYSMGGSRRDMLSYFNPAIDLIDEFWFEQKKLVYDREPLNQYGISNYFQMLSILSLAYLLNIEEGDFKKIASAIEKDGVKDKIYSFLISNRLKEVKMSTNESYQHNFAVVDTYQVLREAISVDNKGESSMLVGRFLKSEWYSNLTKAGVGYLDRHDNKSNSYNGYWCFEAAAVVKIKGLDDSSFRDHPYYPADLVHGMDNPPPKKKKGFFGW